MRNDNFKYVIVKDGYGGAWPVLIPCMLNHSTIPKHLAISAGFCQFTEGRWSCYGESYTLGLKSRPKEDAELMNEVFPA